MLFFWPSDANVLWPITFARQEHESFESKKVSFINSFQKRAVTVLGLKGSSTARIALLYNFQTKDRRIQIHIYLHVHIFNIIGRDHCREKSESRHEPEGRERAFEERERERERA